MNQFLQLCSGILFSLSLQQTLVGSSNKFELSWPTPNTAFVQGLGYHTFLQKTGPGKSSSSGAFGCVRNNGKKFHEGIDLFPVRSSTDGRAKDSVYAAIPGVVRHVNLTSSASAYGKYLVLEHESFDPVLYSLYGHLDSIPNHLKPGMTVGVAERLGRMGNTASFSIPLSRSHLHFEVGIRLSGKFQNWYNRQGFKTVNKHGNFNGYNLAGLDPLHLYSAYQNSSFRSPCEYINSLPVVVKIIIPSRQMPDLVKRNPSLAIHPSPGNVFSSVECSFGPFGFPLKFLPGSATLTQPRIIDYNENYDSKSCRRLVIQKNGKLYPSELLKTYLEILFLE